MRPKIQGFELFFYNYTVKICILGMVVLVARHSKYDFSSPDEILTLEIKIQINFFFEIENFDRKIF